MNLPSNEVSEYDFVIVSDLLEHVSLPAQTALRNIQELLRLGGVAINDCPVSPFPATMG
jgi:2-polyprenyl-3-methyl-5-hydroxy-6-metoxy-1,4-benzoquinol methylase